ncbi:hypothetical protein [Fervidobacterium sp.]
MVKDLIKQRKDMYMIERQFYLVDVVEFPNLNNSNKKAKRSCPLYGGQLAFGME